MKRKLIALLLAAVLCLSLMPCAFALSANEKADKLYALGLFKGKGTLPDGSPDYALSDTATRNEAATMLIRLLGKESKATAQYNAGNIVCPFSDVASWAKGNVSFLYEAGYINGISASLYGGNNTITAQQFAALILRSLGYTEAEKDFTYAGALDFAVAKKLLTSSQSAAWQKAFTREGMAEMCYNALYLNMKSSSKTLYEKLDGEGVFGQQHNSLGSAPKINLSLKYDGGGKTNRWYVQEATNASPLLVDCGNGSSELIFCARSIFALNPGNGNTLWSVASGHDRSEPDAADYAAAGLSPVAADIDGDGKTEIVTVNTHYGYGRSVIAVYSSDGYFKAGWPVYTSHPVRALTVVDTDYDGKCELYIGMGVGAGEDNSLCAFSSTGSLLWDKKLGYGIYSDTITAVSLDGTGPLDIVTTFDDQFIAAFDNKGNEISATGGAYKGISWRNLPLCEDINNETAAANYARSHGICFATADNWLAQSPKTREGRNVVSGTYSGILADDLDGDGRTELFFCALFCDGSKIMRNNVNSYEGVGLYFAPFILNTDRTRYVNKSKGADWTDIPTDVAPIVTLTYTNIDVPDMSPVACDLDKDGNKEILYSAPDGKLHCWSLDKTEHGAWPYTVCSRKSEVSTFSSVPLCKDINGDGYDEVIFTTYTAYNQTAVRGELIILDYTGRVLAKTALPKRFGDPVNEIQANGSRAQPLVADLDGDGRYEIAVTTLTAGIVVYDI